jgi:ABC-type taurine transport system ATPase subunit
VKRAELVDELGRLTERLKPIADRLDQIKRQILSWYESADATERFVIEGTRYVAEISPRAMERRVDVARVYRALGKEQFLIACKFPVTALDALIPATGQTSLVATAQIGPRTVKTVLKFVENEKEAA